jgi:hypothetical protein
MRIRYLLAVAGAIALAPIWPGLAHGAVVVLVATLSGANEVAAGDPDGEGKFTVEIDAEFGDFCYSLTTAKVGKATAANLRSGATGTHGPLVVPLQVASDMCIAVEPDKLKPIVEKPEVFYVSVQTAANPDGAVRGQLVKK